MKTQTVFRLGACAALLTAAGFGVGEAIYLFGTADTVAYSWLIIIVAIFQIFAVIAVYARQAKSGNLFTLIGFVLLVIGIVFVLMNSMGDMGLMTGLLTQAQLAQAGPITSFIVIGAIGNWAFNLGTLALGYGTFRAGVFPRWAGILLLLVGVAIIFRDIPGVEYLFAVLSVVAWGWLGWALWKNPNPGTP